MTSNFKRELVLRFIAESGDAILHLKGQLNSPRESAVPSDFFTIQEGKRQAFVPPPGSFLLRASTEYSNPQLTVEECIGIVNARLLATCVNVLVISGNKELGEGHINAICQALENGDEGPVIPFLMLTDDIEPDRYSINPLRESLYDTKQTAVPVANVETDGLALDLTFLEKYRHLLVTDADAALILKYLEDAKPGGKYVNFIDTCKYSQLATLSGILKLDLCLPATRMPLEVMDEEAKIGGGPIHEMVSTLYASVDSLRRAYDVMGQSMNQFFLTVPMPDLVGSKKLAKGMVVVENNKIIKIKSTHIKKTPLYPNEVDIEDISYAICCHKKRKVEIPIEELVKFDFKKTPLSPQFALYMTQSPENGAIWHGVGDFQNKALVRSYTSMHNAFPELFPGLEKPHPGIPLQFDMTELASEKVLARMPFRNIDASVGCLTQANLEAVLMDAVKVAPIDTAGLVR